ncbi:17671_t:CDS:2 [Funneliformis caledonium]|uniref:17671_t:CDS:1 n=1 Tax=Funneliformis caledonium TaxID=1117310 RepID=A0A9N8W8Z8_9GLOM|nr:17671_t:CDS:2 [Funneliformis caledonium]
MSKENTQIRFVKRPAPGYFDPKETFAILKSPLPTQNELKDDQIMRSNAIGEVVLSKNPKFKVGDMVQAFLGWQKYGLTDGNPPPGAVLHDYLGIFGETGLTAYFGLLESKPKPGDTVVISGAAGATGNIAGQIAKIKGARVIGIAGSEEKCNWLVNDLGFDIALNYRDPEFVKKLAKATPRYIDVYFDNVGGDILDQCLKRIAKNGRIVLCGAISQYNEAQPKGPAFYTALISQRAKMEGFIILDYVKRYPEAINELSKWIQEGKIKRKEFIIEGLENAPEGLLRLFNGHNTGKMLVKVCDENIKSKL